MTENELIDQAKSDMAPRPKLTDAGITIEVRNLLVEERLECPSCHSKRLNRFAQIQLGEVVILHYACNDCHIAWEEHYKFMGAFVNDRTKPAGG